MTTSKEAMAIAKKARKEGLLKKARAWEIVARFNEQLEKKKPKPGT